MFAGLDSRSGPVEQGDLPTGAAGSSPTREAAYTLAAFADPGHAAGTATGPAFEQTAEASSARPESTQPGNDMEYLPSGEYFHNNLIRIQEEDDEPINERRLGERARRHGAQRVSRGVADATTESTMESQPTREWRTPIPPARRSTEFPETLGVGPQWRPENPTLPQEGMNVWMLSVMQSITDKMASLTTIHVPAEEPDFEFSGKPSEDPVAFFEKIERWLVEHRTPRERYHRVFRRCLKGEAYTWFTEIQDQEWPLIRALFLQRFNSTGTVSGLWRQLFGVTQKPGERVGPFVMAKWGLFKRLSPGTPEPERISIICELLHPRIKAYLRGKVFTTLQELIEVGSQVEGDIREQQAAPTPQPRPPTQQQQPQPPRRQPSGPVYHPEVRRPGPPDRPPEAPRARQPPNPCRWCGGNHYNNDCPSRLPPHQPTNTTTQQPQRAEAPVPTPRRRQEPPTSGNGQRAAGAAPRQA